MPFTIRCSGGEGASFWRKDHHFPGRWSYTTDRWFEVNGLPSWMLREIQEAERAAVVEDGSIIQVVKDRHGPGEEIQLIVTMDMIDAERGLANEYLQVKRSLDQQCSLEGGYHHREAYVRTNSRAQVTTLVSYKRLLELLDITNKHIQRLLSRWWEQDCKAQAVRTKPQYKPDWCDCGSFGTHLKGEGVAGACYNTGDAIGDLTKIMQIDHDIARRICFEKWRRNYVKECRSAYAIDAMSFTAYKGGDIDQLKKQATHVALRNLGKKLEEAATITEGTVEGRRYTYDPAYRVEARAIVLTNKELK